MSIKLRLVDFVVKNNKEENFKIQTFGLNKDGETYSVIINGFTPFFYVKVDKNWGSIQKRNFIKQVYLKKAVFFDVISQ